MLTFSVDYFKLNMNCFFCNLLSPEVLWRLSLQLKVLKGTYIHNCIDMNFSIINFVFSFFFCHQVRHANWWNTRKVYDLVLIYRFFFCLFYRSTILRAPKTNFVDQNAHITYCSIKIVLYMRRSTLLPHVLYLSSISYENFQHCTSNWKSCSMYAFLSGNGLK